VQTEDRLWRPLSAISRYHHIQARYSYRIVTRPLALPLSILIFVLISEPSRVQRWAGSTGCALFSSDLRENLSHLFYVSFDERISAQTQRTAVYCTDLNQARRLVRTAPHRARTSCRPKIQ